MIVDKKAYFFLPDDDMLFYFHKVIIYMNAFIGSSLLLFKSVLFAFKTNSCLNSCCSSKKISEPKIVYYTRTED